MITELVGDSPIYSWAHRVLQTPISKFFEFNGGPSLASIEHFSRKLALSKHIAHFNLYNQHTNNYKINKSKQKLGGLPKRTLVKVVACRKYSPRLHSVGSPQCNKETLLVVLGRYKTENDPLGTLVVECAWNERFSSNLASRPSLLSPLTGFHSLWICIEWVKWPL